MTKNNNIWEVIEQFWLILNNEVMFLTHEYFMRLALQEAKKAIEEGEIPIGAVVVCEQNVLAKALALCVQELPTGHSWEAWSMEQVAKKQATIAGISQVYCIPKLLY